jgi:hypothetical protein
MHLERFFAHIVAGYLIAIGLFFGFASVIQIPYIDVQPSGQFSVLGISVVFAVFGIGSLYLLRKGKLKKEGAAISEVRQEAIEKMNDAMLLSRIATQDSDAKLRKVAQERLSELEGEH